MHFINLSFTTSHWSQYLALHHDPQILCISGRILCNYRKWY